MATIRKKNDKWHVQVRRKGYPAVSRSFQLKDWAIRWAQETERNISKGLILPSISDLKGYLLRDLLERYLREITPTKRGVESEKYRLQQFLRDPISSLSLNLLSPMVLAAYRDRRLTEVSSASVRRELNIIRHCLEIAQKEWGIPIPNNPVKGLRLPLEGPSRTRRPSSDEIAKLLQEAAKRVWYLVPIIKFAMATGMRRGEILSLAWMDIDQAKQIALLKLTKNGHPRAVPLSPVALEVIASLPKDDSRLFPVSPNGLRLAWGRLCKAAGVEDLHFHDFRHEAISRFFEMGLTHPEVAQISGHKEIKMLFRYAHAQHSIILQRLNQGLQHNLDTRNRGLANGAIGLDTT